MIGAEGGTVVGVDLDQAAVEQIMDGICRAGGKAHGLVANALEAADVARVVRQTIAACGRIDILVNAVGGSTIIPNSGATVDVLTLDEWQRLLAFNLNGTFLFCNAVAPIMKSQRSGKIVNISSIAARTGSGSSLAYLAAKAGVDALTIALAKVLAPKIRVFSVSPAGVDTDFVAGRSREQLQKIAEKLPLAHVTTPDDVARAAVACIVSLTSSTGIVVPVDEGRHL